MSLRRASAKSPTFPPTKPSHHSCCRLLVPPGRLPVPMLTNTPISRPGHSFTAASSSICVAGLYFPAPSSRKTDCPIWIGLNASPIAEVARPACHIVQLNSGGGSLLESHDLKSMGTPFFGVPLNTAVTALLFVSRVHSIHRCYLRLCSSLSIIIERRIRISPPYWLYSNS